MEVAHIIPNFIPPMGGVEAYVRDLMKVLESAGCSQVIYQRKKEVIDNDPRVMMVKLLPIPFRSFRRSLYRHAFQFAKKDLLIVHDLNNFMPMFAGKTIGVSHGLMWRPSAEAGVPIPKKKRRAMRAFKSALSIVANDTEFYREMGLVINPGEKAFEEIAHMRWFIPNCVDTDVFKRTEPIESLASLNAVIVARRVEEARGIHLAIAAFRHFLDEVRGSHLVIVGDFAIGNNTYQNRLFALIHEKDLVGRVLFTGRVPRLVMPKLYSSCILAVVPTIRSEGTSLSALESMACGVPTVSTDVEGLKDLPTVKCGLDEKLMARKMLDVYERREEIARQQSEKVRAEFNLGRWAEAWTKVIEKCRERIRR